MSEIIGQYGKPKIEPELEPSDNKNIGDDVKVKEKGGILPKTLLWFGYGLALTFIIAFGLPAILQATMGFTESYVYALFIMCGIGAVGVLIFSIIAMVKSFSAKGFGVITFTLYAVFMGLALSPLALLATDPVGFLGIVYSLGITAAIFAIMGVIGILSKGKIGLMLTLVIGLSAGSLILSLINIFVFSETIYWIVSFAILLFFIIYVGIDFAVISQHDDNPSNNLAILFAFNLYTDFIVIFIRLLPIILRIVASSRD